MAYNLGAAVSAVDALWAGVKAPGTTVHQYSREGMGGVFMHGVDAQRAPRVSETICSRLSVGVRVALGREAQE